MKIVIFNNDGYLMIKHTQNALVEGRRAGTDTESGLSCPDYSLLVRSFGFDYLSLKNEDESEIIINSFLETKKPVVLEVFMDPQQLLVPKLSVSVNSDGKLISPPLEDLSPLIPEKQLEDLLMVPIHTNSIALKRETKEAKGDAIY